MAKLVALYQHPENPANFDAYYFGTHIPIVKTISQLRGYTVNQGPVAAPDGSSPYHLVALLSFDTFDDLQKGLGSAEGQAAVADLANFAGAGVEILIFEEKEV